MPSRAAAEWPARSVTKQGDAWRFDLGVDNAGRARIKVRGPAGRKITLVHPGANSHTLGRGYPGGLRAEQIPVIARVLTFADSFDAMTTDRPYRAAMAPAAAFQRLEDGRGQQWDPDVVDVFLAEYAGRSEPQEIAEGL